MSDSNLARNVVGMAHLDSAMPATAAGALAALRSQELARWFLEHVGTPTACQRLAWPLLTHGQSVLITAPTGAGKTLAALVPLWDTLLVNGVNQPAVTVVFVVPLKALATDVTARLAACMNSLAERFGRPLFTVGTRTGDTPPAQRRAMWEHPPSIVVTTPESLDLLLAHPAAPTWFANLRAMVVDEAHDLAATKRGAGLAVAMERLERLAPRPLQRIGLSATCTPAAAVAAWLAGRHHTVRVASVPPDSRFHLDVKHLGSSAGTRFLPGLYRELEAIIRRHELTLVFTDTRGFAERLAWGLRRRMADLADQIGIHHGSLDLSQRAQVEEAMVTGKMRAVVTSSSLELGIDLGPIDHVVLVRPAGGTVRLLQRLGRSGHRPGAARSGTVFVGQLADAMEAVVARAAGAISWLEPLTVLERPLDVLAQQLIGLSLAGDLTAAAAWELVCGALPFQKLNLGDYVAVLQYLTGGTAAMPLPCRVTFRDHRLVCIDRQTAVHFRRNVGTILDEHHVGVMGEDARLWGHVSLRFADRLQPGESFLLNGRSVQLIRRDSGRLVVSELGCQPALTKWDGRLWSTAPALIERLWNFRVRVRDALLEGHREAWELLRGEFGVPEELIGGLIELFEAQEAESEVPTNALLVEAWPSADGAAWWHAMHFPLPARAGEGVARVFARRLGWPQFTPMLAGTMVCGIASSSRGPVEAAILQRALSPNGFRDDLKATLGTSPLLARRFTEVAQTGLMILRHPARPPRRVGGGNWAGERLLPWLRFRDPESPLVRQAVSETLDHDFAVDLAERTLVKMAARPLRLRLLSGPSPFTLAWLPEISQAPSTLESFEDRLQQWHQEEIELASQAV